MRTTLTLDDDILGAAKCLAEHRGVSLGLVISELARRALEPTDAPLESRNGFPQLRGRAGLPRVTLELVNALRDDDPLE